MAFNNRCSHRHRPKSGLSRVIFGLIIIFIGALLLADNLGVLPFGVKEIIFTWQMLVIGIGLVNLANKEWFSGLILVFIGSFFLVPEHIHFGFDFTRLFWPVLLIGLGLMIVIKMGFRRNKPSCEFGVTDSTADTIDDTAVFGGGKKIIITQQFRGGRLLALFGGLEIDFTQSKLAPGTHVLEMFCLFGGVTLIFPPDWQIHNQITAVLGGVEDKRRLLITDNSGNQSVLVLRGLAILGGGEVKSYGRPSNN